MLGMIATSGQNGQFRTPRHIIKLMVELTKPTPKDLICDPACGTCGFLVAAGGLFYRRLPGHQEMALLSRGDGPRSSVDERGGA
jgi:type I restriction enzyme M protein